MDTKKNPILILILFTGIFTACECVGGAHHSFSEKIAFGPERLDYHIGDTIWVTSKFSCRSLFNTETGQNEDYCGIEESIAVSLFVFLLEPWPQDTLGPTPAAVNFDFLNINGSASPANDRTVHLFFQTQGDEYIMKIGIIPRILGQFSLGLSRSGGEYKLPKSKKCDTGAFGFTLDVKDNHIFLLENFKGAQNVTEDERLQTYCFEVIL